MFELYEHVRIKKNGIIGTIVDISKSDDETIYIVESDEKGKRDDGLIEKIRKYFSDYFKEKNLGEANERTVIPIAYFSNEKETALMILGIIMARNKESRMFEVRYFADTEKMSVFIYEKAETEIFNV